jgi:hypothetical protein
MAARVILAGGVPRATARSVLSAAWRAVRIGSRPTGMLMAAPVMTADFKKSLRFI